MTNPPFGGEEEKGIQRNFPEDKQTSETALLFLQLIMRKLRRHGRDRSPAGERESSFRTGLLSGGGGCRPYQGGAASRTSTCIPSCVCRTASSRHTHRFRRTCSSSIDPAPQRRTWYYEHPLPEGRKNYTKTKPLQFEEFGLLFEWWSDRKESEQTWRVPVDVFKTNGFNLDLKNPSAPARLEHLPPKELLENVLTKERRIAELVKEISVLLDGESDR